MTSTRIASFPSLPLTVAREEVRVFHTASIHQIERSMWDELVPKDVPHLRYDFLRAVEDSGFGRKPNYFCVSEQDRLVGVTVAYVLPVDLLTLAPPQLSRWIAPLRRCFPGLLYLTSVTCGPIITNCNHNFFITEDLTPDDRREVITKLIREVNSISEGSVTIMIEFPEEAADAFEEPMTAQGFLRAPSLPGTRLPVHWEDLDGYIASMRKAFRRTVLKDRKAAAELDFEVVNDFSDLAEEAWALYANVLEKADHVFEKLTPEFFRELASFEQSRLVTARDRATGKLVGIELLLCGENTLQDLYTGLDYAYNSEQRLYFNLLYPVIGFAGEKGFKAISLGQTSYTFKARLGGQPYPLSIFVRHKNRVIHRLLCLLKSVLFPETPTTTYNVFRSPDENDASAPSTSWKTTKVMR